METRANQDGTNTSNTKMLMGIVGAVVLVLIVWMVLSPKRPIVETRDSMNTPNTVPVIR